ncbi:hypothetical protein Acr_07g0010280 [Actinidia rufa]|uniref:Uncharacterized protein n=1 Tax=Actinidia rufa TaxID=165716 RepID=A0A7J0EWH4_9ERIC|nr:hypothetical protein Acr_07g0010280 [Actinidia rufa]
MVAKGRFNASSGQSWVGKFWRCRGMAAEERQGLKLPKFLEDVKGKWGWREEVWV